MAPPDSRRPAPTLPAVPGLPQSRRLLVVAVCAAGALPQRAAEYTSSLVLPYGGASLAMRLQVAQTWPEVMEIFAKDERFREQHWGKAPFLARIPLAAGCFSVDDVRAAAGAGELLAGQNDFLLKNPDSFVTVKTFSRGSSITAALLEDGLANGTMVLNSASSRWVQLFDIVRAGVRAVQLPVNINVYITHSSLERSVPLHTDRQDTIILQCEGRKHWQVHGALVGLPAEHQERGKSGDLVTETEAGPRLLEATLSPGSVLYVPRGFAHRTLRPPVDETLTPGSTAASDFSTSLTIGLETESMGFTYDKLLLCALFLHGEGSVQHLPGRSRALVRS
mmetsp:Transcript_57636/g.187249  ORF Transcript_57636/g.187249 Transcript_57636/m.187249 type:complete len:336 (-) Transcript_57636:3-1010(-)